MSDDTALVQAASDSGVPLPNGIFTINDTIIVQGNKHLAGSGVRGTNDPNIPCLGTMLVPGSSFPVSKPMVWVQNGTSRVEDLQIGYWRMPRLAEVGLMVGNMAQPIDRVFLKNVAVTGNFGMTFLSARAVSSMMEFCQFWQFQPGTFCAQFENSSTWTLNGVEVHLDAVSPSAAPLWLTGGSFCIGMYGGLISRALNDAGPLTIGSGLYLSPTTFQYQESP